VTERKNLLEYYFLLRSSRV
jgi:hypothetical protein